MTEPIKLGVIGGSGVYQIEALTEVEEVRVRTPFGDPSDAFVVGRLAGGRVAFLARHGRGHRLMPTEVNSRANIWAFKSLSVERIVSISACGSMKEDYAPGHIVIPDQLFDRTRGRPLTFFGEGIVAHISVAEPFCAELSRLLAGAVRRAGGTVHEGGTFVTIEGPRFSTKAESRIFRQWDVDIIGMTAIPEAFLAREAEICYATMAHVTDYDVWHEAEEPVTVEAIIATLMANAELSKRAVAELVPTIPGERTCECATTLSNAIITERSAIPAAVKEKLAPIIGKYI